MKLSSIIHLLVSCFLDFLAFPPKLMTILRPCDLNSVTVLTTLQHFPAKTEVLVQLKVLRVTFPVWDLEELTF